MLKFKGCDNFRQRIAFACISGKAIRVDEIRSEDEAPGLRSCEASLLRLTEKISNGCVVEINETGMFVLSAQLCTEHLSWSMV
jgi:RNA 3'-terminal phosphate cyclase-like protein